MKPTLVLTLGLAALGLAAAPAPAGYDGPPLIAPETVPPPQNYTPPVRSTPVYSSPVYPTQEYAAPSYSAPAYPPAVDSFGSGPPPMASGVPMDSGFGGGAPCDCGGPAPDMGGPAPCDTCCGRQGPLRRICGRLRDRLRGGSCCSTCGEECGSGRRFGLLQRIRARREARRGCCCPE